LQYIAREWIPPPPITKVDWDKEIEEEIENQKRKKKSSGVSANQSMISEPTKPAASPVNIVIPSPLPKPHSPKNSRTEGKKATVTSSSADLLGIGLETLSLPASLNSSGANIIQKNTAPSDNFDFFSNVPSSSSAIPPVELQQTTNGASINNNSLKQEEDDFFNQKTVENGLAEKGKMTKDSILALYGNAPSFTPPQAQPSFNANFQQYPRAPQEAFFAYGQQPAPQPQQQAFGNFGNFNANFGTMQTQQINKLNEENIKKIESLNFNNFK
jgi:stromal membrane-associated protein